MRPARPVVYACSPRPGGNTDLAADLFAQGLGLECDRFAVRGNAAAACLGCHHCDRDPQGACVLADRDRAEELLDPLHHAPLAGFAAPIFFYHLPASFKALIDRAQSRYARKRRGDADMRALPRRKAWVILVAGRVKGDKLFDGALLTLKYFLEPFNIHLAEPLLLRGMDGPGDLADDPGARESVLAYGRAAAADLEG